jgi:PTH1 family peptidyl-tRNA hydrolase
MHLVAGLGNPGEEYENTPHNLGFQVLDRLAEMHGIRVNRKDSRALMGVGEISGKPVMLAKPQTFMNLSGTSLQPLMQKHSIEARDLILVYDELDLPWSETRIKTGGSSAGHNGVESVISSLGTKDFTRVRLGISPGHKVSDGAAYVLAPIRRSQQKELEQLVARGAEAVVSIIAEGVAKSMTVYNRRAQGLNTEEE